METRPAEASDPHQPRTGVAYDHAAVEEKWRERWAAEQTYKADLDGAERPYFNLMMFPYPSAEGLHAGHCFTFSGADAHGRFRRMQGHEVFQPMGWDAFGIHSENYALKVNEHPARLTPRTVANFKRQMMRLGAGFDWSHELNTTDPGYYRWTQWIFVQLMKRGLAVQKEAAVNWCPRDMTVLADEQVIQGRCERCDSVVERRILKQWFLRITEYAQQLLDGLGDIDWSEVVTTAQRNWIGRSEGAMIRFDLERCERKDVTVFTTRPDTLFGATFLVVGADHPDLLEFVAPERRQAVERWREELPAETEEPDFSIGIDIGSAGVHPLSGERIPVYAAPYVLGGYGTGAIMAVPAHDERDWQFARAHRLPIVEVISGGDVQQESYAGTGVMVNSGDLNGTPSDEGKKRVVAQLQAKGRGEQAIQYRLRDWLISRQRYWGPPIPVIHCQNGCGAVPVPEDQLPVLLPDVEDFKPIGTGVSPLASVEDWVNVECPQCGGPGRRETDVSDTFLDSSWYFLRYPSTEFAEVPFDHARTWKWLPVSIYIGGKEHSVLHLLYSRFVMRALHDAKLVPAAEPFPIFFAHGMIIKDGAKMSKSRGNVVSPDLYMDRYGADTLRVYLLFLGPYDLGGDFRDEGINGAVRFLNRVWRLGTTDSLIDDRDDDKRERRRHALVKGVTERVETLRYNTAIALLMSFSDELNADAARGDLRRVDVETLLQLLAPLAPHLTEELWERAGHSSSIHRSRWPEFDESLAAQQEATIAVQVNGKVRDTLRAPVGLPSEDVQDRARRLPRIEELLRDRTVRKAIVVPDRVVNFVVG